MTMTIRVDGADELIGKISATRTALLEDVRRETAAAGKAMRQTARGLAKSKSMPGLSRSIFTYTRQLAGGIEVTVEARSPFGYLREFGYGRAAPHPFMEPALHKHLPDLESALSDALARQPL